MKVYVVRHADAGSSDPKTYPDDSLRPLSADGKSEMLRIAHGMRRLGIEFDEIFDSGYTRARQTAECICEAYERGKSSIRIMKELAPECEPESAAAALRTMRERGAIALVGHQPHLSRFVGYMIAGNPDLPSELKKGGVCRIDVTDWSAGGAKLVSFLPPRALRMLAT